MPQIFQVLRCYKCCVFQVYQTKKTNKFECKMCGEKQSIKRHYGLGNGQECRKHVQKLNGIRGKIEESKSSQSISSDDEKAKDHTEIPVVQNSNNKQSKWSEYVEKENPETHNSDNDEMYLDNTEVVLEMPKKRRKFLGKGSHGHNGFKSSTDTDANYVCSALPKHSLISSDCSQIGNAVTKITPPKEKIILGTEFETYSRTLRSKSSNCKTVGTENVLNGHKFSVVSSKITPVQTNNVNRKKFVPPPVNKDSKWVEFTEDTDLSDDKDLKESSSQEISQNNSHTLFSLCDDSDLDDYLTI